MFVDEKQPAALQTDHLDLIEYGFEEFLFFVLFRNLQLKRIEGGKIALVLCGIGKCIDFPRDQDLMLAGLLRHIGNRFEFAGRCL